MALQLLQNYNSHNAWAGWDDGSCNLATATEPHRLCKTAVPLRECCIACGPPAADLPRNSVSNALDSSEDDILYEQSEDSDTSDSEELSFINVDGSDAEFLGFPDDSRSFRT